jgi:hypothetical protein
MGRMLIKRSATILFSAPELHAIHKQSSTGGPSRHSEALARIADMAGLNVIAEWT